MVPALARACLVLSLGLGPLVFSTTTHDAFELPKAALLHLTAIALLALGGISLARPGPRAPALRESLRDPLVLAALLALASAGLSTAWSASPRTSLLGADGSHAGLITAAAATVVFFAARAVAASPATARALVLAPALGAAGAAGYALAQLAGLDPIAWTDTAPAVAWTRPFGTLGHPLLLGGALAVAWPLAVHAALTARGRAARGTLAGVSVLIAAAVAASSSRGAWLALAAALAVLALGLRRAGRPGLRLILAGGLAAALLALLPAVLPTLRCFPLPAHLGGCVTPRPLGAEARLHTVTSRLDLWQVAWTAFREHPATGIGLDAFALAMERHFPPAYWRLEWGKTVARAHNEALDIAATRGALGLGAAGALGLAFLVGLRRGLRRASAPEDRGRLIALAAAVAAYGAVGLSGFPSLATTALIAAGLGLVSRAAAPPGPDPDAEAPALAAPRRRPLARAWVMIVIAAAALAAPLLVTERLAASASARRALVLGARDPAGAVAALEEAVRLDPRRDTYWARLGAACRAAAPAAADPARVLARGRAALEQAVALVPARAEHHAALGQLLLDAAALTPPAGAVAEAVPALRRAVALSPSNPYYRVALTRALAAAAGGDAARRAEAAVQAWTCGSMFPEFGPCRSQLAYFRLLAGDAAGAARELEQALAGRWDGDPLGPAVARSNLAHALNRLGRHAEAVPLASQALEQIPRYADARLNRAEALERLGRHAEALADHRAVLLDAPGHAASAAAVARLGAAAPRR